MTSSTDVWQVDTSANPNARALVDRCRDFFADIKDLTPGQDLEVYLNQHYGPGNQIYEDLCSLVKVGVQEGWACNTEIDGRRYRRSKVILPSEMTRYFSITTVWMDSQSEYSGEYHKHVYGEINCLVPFDDSVEMKGMQGWRKQGWTSPAAGTHHFPQVGCYNAGVRVLTIVSSELNAV